MLAGGAALGLVSGSSSTWLEFGFATLVVTLGVLVMRLFAFMSLDLDGTQLIVRGLFREWRVPVSQVDDVTVRDFGFPISFAFGRITLTESVPGLGAQLRFVAPMLVDTADVEGTIEAARIIARIGT
jgi:hypothetical protein